MFEDVVLAATAQDFDGTIQKIEFFANTTLIGESTSSPARITWGNLSAGEYQIYARATDNDGKTAVTPTITIHVSDKYEKSFLSPAKGLMISNGSNFDIQLDTEGVNNIKSIAYYNGTTLLNSTATPPYLVSMNNTTSGIYKLSAVITLNNDKQLKAEGPSVFVLPSKFDCDHTGMMNIDFWNNVSGTTIASIPTGNFPTESGMVDIFEGPANRADDYGLRIAGYICPPQTGEYTFWTSGDDNNKISIKMPDADTLKVLAYVSDWTSPRSWVQYASQQSEPITLQAGQMYLVEGLLKEGSGGDHFAVGWKLPDGTLERPIPGSRITPLYNPLTLKDDVIVKIISPTDGAILNRNDSITIVAEVQKGISDVSMMKFYTSSLTMAGTDKTAESNIYTFKTKLTTGSYKLTARGMYKHILTIPSNTISITVKTITGVDDADSDFEVYPNPLTMGSLSIKLPSEATQLSIFDVTGKLIYKETGGRHEYLIDESVFKSKGVYLISVTTSRHSINKKVIVTK